VRVSNWTLATGGVPGAREESPMSDDDLELRTTIAAAAKYDCCRDPANLERRATGQEPSLGMFMCRVCQRRHFHAEAERGEIGVTGSKI
jgi:hypothetical protein